MVVRAQLHIDTVILPVEKILTVKDLSLLKCDGVLLGR
jgi:hypothetical protein